VATAADVVHSRRGGGQRTVGVLCVVSGVARELATSRNIKCVGTSCESTLRQVNCASNEPGSMTTMATAANGVHSRMEGRGANAQWLRCDLCSAGSGLGCAVHV
jgi:hypothetical protein